MITPEVVLLALLGQLLAGWRFALSISSRLAALEARVAALAASSAPQDF